MRLLLYLNTLRHLKFKQMFWLLKYKLLSTKKPRSFGARRRYWVDRWYAPTWHVEQWDNKNQFTFLSKTYDIVGSEDWSDLSKGALWLYNLHYLNSLTTQQNVGEKEGLLLIHKWMSNNKDVSKIGWDPYCTSLRLVNIIKWMSKNDRSDPKIIESIELQAYSLLHKIEFNIQANHLFTNIKALLFVGCFLDGKIAERCMQRGRSLLLGELTDQFLEDGGHYELSPMYHQILFWDLLDLKLLISISKLEILQPFDDLILQLVIKADSWRRAMRHPDGNLSFFNDSAFGIAPPSHLIDAYLALFEIDYCSFDEKSVHLKESGYFSILLPPDGKLILDAGNIKPDFQPGHSHADTLSFELSLFGQRFFVNSGTSTYEVCETRKFQRSSKAHNTISVDENNSSQVWGGFRVAKRAEILEAEMKSIGDQIQIFAAHNGFIKQGIAGVHSRELLIELNSIEIKDVLTNIDNMSPVARFYLHPEVKTNFISKHSAKLIFKQEEVEFFTDGDLSIINTNWYPEFGKSISNTCLEVHFTSGNLTTRIFW